ncbi:TPA: transglutaminase family protein [Burkholderia aenigmatica]|uniref:transglutaminase family protein n=1 Tax=Burkholderia sp. AU45251 TaxID=3059204 RepID=UPI002654150B|nr:transglutaminase family protein [Burkholderia sp. AU45251]HDR9481807.1 transglutaminase family protein [Burkholderia aenigmatica]MDN7513567.1 transglutaminase family protein [Burkholderia sp. AU45251]HDR9513334.1 transglutaminase family protein [Burkholderia aenigmatica]HDR9590178.1 transglutaminase family protein [Burkholderia aenigmatica]HDR9601785.1 transglutaminase family protein [Burkholderia aenigmatica]
MRLAIRHISRYQFDDQATHALQRLRLRPQSGPGQTVRAWQVTIDGVEPTLSYADGLGNRIDLVRHDRGAKAEIVVIAAGVVETQDRAGILGNPEGYAPPWIFERETALTKAGDTVRALAQALPIEPHSLDALHWLMTEVHDRIAYAPNLAAEAPVDAETALQSGEGTSRDHAHAFIAAARVLKIPARYISGYVLADSAMQRIADAKQNTGDSEEEEEALALQSGEGMQQVLGASHAAQSQSQGMPQPAHGAQPQAAGLMQQPAGHAWAEAYVEGLGWVGFDPFMNRCPDERYVRIAVGLDYRDAQPVTGLGATAVGVEISVVQTPELV